MGAHRVRQHRMSRGVTSTFESYPDNHTTALVTALKKMLEDHDPEDIVILSPFGEHHSLVGSFLARADSSQHERWLRKQLVLNGSSGQIRWRSIFKFKGGEADAVILTDTALTVETSSTHPRRVGGTFCTSA